MAGLELERVNFYLADAERRVRELEEQRPLAAGTRLAAQVEQRITELRTVVDTLARERECLMCTTEPQS